MYIENTVKVKVNDDEQRMIFDFYNLLLNIERNAEGLNEDILATDVANLKTCIDEFVDEYIK